MIHATDSTCTGWTANTAATSHAPGTWRWRSRRHTSTEFSACSAMLTAW